MQVYVSKSALGLADPVPILGYYLDDPVLARDQHGSSASVLSLPMSALDIPSITRGAPSTQLQMPTQLNQSRSTLLEIKMPTLKPSWRDNMTQIVQDEANRRILESFPDYMQRNANAVISNLLVQYGSDLGAWPQDALDRKAASDAGWNYVQAVRERSDALESQITLTDPTDDAHWPTRIPPVYV